LRTYFQLDHPTDPRYFAVMPGANPPATLSNAQITFGAYGVVCPTIPDGSLILAVYRISANLKTWLLVTDRGCDHPTFAARVEVDRLTDAPVWYANLTLTCEVCGEAMPFVGLPMGLSPGEPMVDVAGTQARIPFRAFTAAAAEARGLDPDQPGYTVTLDPGVTS
jgi:hypothetical protein